MNRKRKKFVSCSVEFRKEAIKSLAKDVVFVNRVLSFYPENITIGDNV